MTEHPLLYTSEMVIRILTCAKCGKISIKFPCCHCDSEEFCKTQTRRVIKNPQRLEGLMLEGEAAEWCSYGKVGDRLWVRETWCYAAMSGYDARDDGGEVWYRATDAGICEGPWKPSIHMFRKHTRIWLEITNVRVERVQDIGESGAITEGVERYETAGLKGWKPYKYFTKNTVEYKAMRHSSVCLTARDSFISLWDSINAKRYETIHHADGIAERRQLNYGWAKNTWVWVIEFKRIVK